MISQLVASRKGQSISPLFLGVSQPRAPCCRFATTGLVAPELQEAPLTIQFLPFSMASSLLSLPDVDIKDVPGEITQSGGSVDPV